MTNISLPMYIRVALRRRRLCRSTPYIKSTNVNDDGVSPPPCMWIYGSVLDHVIHYQRESIPSITYRNKFQSDANFLVLLLVPFGGRSRDNRTHHAAGRMITDGKSALYHATRSPDTLTWTMRSSSKYGRRRRPSDPNISSTDTPNPMTLLCS